MAFNIDNLRKVATNGENQILTYDAGTDGQTTAAASGYFDDAVEPRKLKTGDILFITSDSKSEFQVFLITVTAGVVTVAAAATES